jgi:hypothetical protein
MEPQQTNPHQFKLCHQKIGQQFNPVTKLLAASAHLKISIAGETTSASELVTPLPQVCRAPDLSLLALKT